MSQEIDHGYYKEYKSTPQEKKVADLQAQIDQLSSRVEVLERMEVSDGYFTRVVKNIRNKVLRKK